MRQASPGVIEMSMWRTIVSTIAVAIASGARWSARFLRGLASGDQVFTALHLASTTFPSADDSSEPCVPELPAQPSPHVMALHHAIPMPTTRRLHRDIGATPV